MSDGLITKQELSQELKDSIQKVEVVDNLTTDDPTKALSARQGKELFQSVSNGKNLIASAITDKGVSTSEEDTFQIMADNIVNIETGKKSASGRATSSGVGDFILSNGDITSRPYVLVTGLDFKPSYICIEYGTTTTLYLADRIKTNRVLLSTPSENFSIKEEIPVAISYNAFLLPVYISDANVDWWAFE